MRPTSRPQSALRQPFNYVLATEANVRLLRELVRTTQPVAPSVLARQAQLNLSGAIRALDRLEEMGIIERVGAGSRRPVVLVRQHPLVGAIGRLFAAEHERFEGVVDRLRDAAERTKPSPISVWIEGRVATGDDGPGDPVIVSVLARASEVGTVVASFERALGNVERELDVTIEVRGRTNADLEASGSREIAALRVAIPILGAPPTALRAFPGRQDVAARTTTRPLTHGELDGRARLHGERLAALIHGDPGIVDRARHHLAQQMESPLTANDRTIREWDRLLRTMSVARLRRFLVDPGERATRLRQSMPFFAVLTEEQRGSVLDAAGKRAGGSRKS